MTTLFRTTLQFVTEGPAVTGDWTDDATARRAWRSWIGLYGSDENVTVRLTETAHGHERALALWERGHEVEPHREEVPPA